jgi:hypothetical protein
MDFRKRHVQLVGAPASRRLSVDGKKPPRWNCTAVPGRGNMDTDAALVET